MMDGGDSNTLSELVDIVSGMNMKNMIMSDIQIPTISNSVPDVVPDEENKETEVEDIPVLPRPRDIQSLEPSEDISPVAKSPNGRTWDAHDAKGCWSGGFEEGNGTVASSSTVVMPVHMDSEVYNMNHPTRGRAVIFNHENFNSNLDLGRRSGTEKDRQNLKQSLKSLGFEVSAFDDLTYQEVVKEIEALTKEDHGNRDCLLIAVLSHGDTNMMYAKDYYYKPDMLWQSFTAEKVPTLAGKPKIFLIQACQGSMLDEGTKLVKVSNRTEVDSNPQSYRIPNHADFLIVYSTFPGHYAWRNTTNGSWFIQAVCQVLQKYATKKDLLSMMTIVSREVALRFESNTPSLPHMHQKKQIPFVTSTLIRDVYMVPK